MIHRYRKINTYISKSFRFPIRVKQFMFRYISGYRKYFLLSTNDLPISVNALPISVFLLTDIGKYFDSLKAIKLIFRYRKIYRCTDIRKSK